MSFQYYLFIQIRIHFTRFKNKKKKDKICTTILLIVSINEVDSLIFDKGHTFINPQKDTKHENNRTHINVQTLYQDL